MGGRLARMLAAAEARGPLDPATGQAPDDGEFALIQQNTALVLPPLVGEVVFSDSPEERARLADEHAGLDCETCLIQPGRNTPRLVVTGYQFPGGQQAIVTGDARDPTTHARAFLAFTDHLIEKRKVLVNQNIAFDFCVIAEDAHQCDVLLGLVGKEDSFFELVMQRIFSMLDALMVEDTMLRERLLDLAEGTLGKNFASMTVTGNPRKKFYNLKALGQYYLNVELDKVTWRTGYARLLNKPLSEYEPGAVKYLTEDVETALRVSARQTQRAHLHGLSLGATIPNSAEQTKAAFSLQLVSSWGMRTDMSKVEQLGADLDVQSREMLRLLTSEGLIRDDGTRDMKRTHALVEKMYVDEGLTVPRTEKGNISTAGAVLEDIALIKLRGSSKDVLNDKGQLDEAELLKEPLYVYSQYASIQKLQTTYMPVLKMGTQHPINTRFETILETGRISSYQPNLNNIPRGGKKTNLQRLQARVRQCFVPRPGFVFCSVDYNMLELCTLAQCLLWFFKSSKMADAINEGFDLHTLFAAEQLLHIPYEDALQRKKDKDVADMRQLAKAGNFGMCGGMGSASFAEFAKATYNLYISLDEAKLLKEKWLCQWPEMRAYFRLIGSMMKGFDDKGQTVGDLEQFVSGRIRGRTRYCAMANSFFQGLASDGAKSALYALQKACYLVNGSLYGSRVVAFFYDEFLMEHPEETAHERAEIQTQIAVTEMQQICVDVRISAAPALMGCWMKEADEAWNATGTRRVPWKPDVVYVKKDGKSCEPPSTFQQVV